VQVADSAVPGLYCELRVNGLYLDRRSGTDILFGPFLSGIDDYRVRNCPGILGVAVVRGLCGRGFSRSTYVSGRRAARRRWRGSALVSGYPHGAAYFAAKSQQPQQLLEGAWESPSTLSAGGGFFSSGLGPPRAFRGARASDPDSVLAGLMTAVVVLGSDLRVNYLNAAAENLLGISLRRSFGRPVGELVQPPGELTALCQRALDDGVTYGRRELEARVGNREFILDCRVSPLDTPDGQLLLELTDTQRDRQLRREAELIAQRQLSRRIIRQLAHEVKNPLGGLRGAAQLLERQLPSSELKRYTEVIIEEADRLAALVDSILKAGGDPKSETYNLHEITEHVGTLIEAEKPEGIELVRDYDPSLPLTTSDRGQLIQAFLNLAKNAMQALGESGQLTFRTRALTNFTLGGQKYRLVLSLEVEDDGPGIPDELKETIFYPLVTGRETGTGLGLTIAQDLVSRNGGLIEFSSRPGETTFKVRLPVSSGPGGS
jgi:two-component system nitrogen regulation sensor histidine kinase GlnL